MKHHGVRPGLDLRLQLLRVMPWYDGSPIPIYGEDGDGKTWRLPEERVGEYIPPKSSHLAPHSTIHSKKNIVSQASGDIENIRQAFKIDQVGSQIAGTTSLCR